MVSVTDKDDTGAVAQIVQYTYDALNRRIGKSVDDDGDASIDSATYFVYDREDVILDYVDADGAGAGTPGLAVRYLHGPGPDMILAQEDTSGVK